MFVRVCDIFLVWNFIIFNGACSMEQHLSCRHDVGGSIPLCPIYINQWLIKLPVNNNQWLNKWLGNNNIWLNKWINILSNKDN